jgi:RNA-directed DNA polymerase
MNPSSKDGKPSTENEEGSPLIKENAGQPNTHPTLSGERVSQGLAGVRKVARDHKEMKFTALLHHLTVDQASLPPLQSAQGWASIIPLLENRDA